MLGYDKCWEVLALSKFNLEYTLDQARQLLRQREPLQIALKSWSEYDQTNDCFTLAFLGQQYLIHYPDGSLMDAAQVEPYVQILLLHYLSNASGDPLTGKMITFKELPGGSIYRDPFNSRSIRPLLQRFGNCPQQLVAAAFPLGGEQIELGDAAVRLAVFPRIPMTLALWQGDEDIPANGTILFDSSAQTYLPTEDYAVMAQLVVQRLIASHQQP